MRIWINKQETEEIPVAYNNSLVFNMLEENNLSNLKSDIEKLWRSCGNTELSSINEDLLVLSIAVFAADKRVNRSKSFDAWTRDIELNVPVLEYEKWYAVKERLNSLLGFLSGDRWNVQFRKTHLHYRNNSSRKKYNQVVKHNIEMVSLFSGGLDSFCGAIKLLEEGKKVCFVGFREYGHLEIRQNKIFSILESNYPNVQKDLLVFNSNPYCPLDIYGNKLLNNGENTSRSRSFMFLAGALAVASQIGSTIPIMIPENGFIGINVPLTDSRRGSCSTRTTHPYFIKKLNELLIELDIKNPIENMYAYRTKGEIVEELKNVPAFKEGYDLTISCSHPCQARMNKKTIPMNCGYCYPCIIRKASLNQINIKDENYDYNNVLSMEFVKKHGLFKAKKYNPDDLKAILSSIYRFKHLSKKEVKALIMQTGNLSVDEVNMANRVYSKTMLEIEKLVVKSVGEYGGKIGNYAGIGEHV